jgi:hypothetical protein
MEAMQSAGSNLVSTGGGDFGQWVVRSEVLADYQVITHGWVDNEWDSQRRRRLAATSRLTY